LGGAQWQTSRRDASDPASPRPVDTPQQASRSDSPDRGKLRVFISYSREDLRFADQLYAALNAYGFECFIDREGISGGEDWKRRLGNLIRDADTVVFVLSPSSAGSEICVWEVEEIEVSTTSSKAGVCLDRSRISSAATGRHGVRPIQPRPVEGDVGHRALPHGGTWRPCRALRVLLTYAHRLALSASHPRNYREAM
jgi:TIR domain